MSRNVETAVERLAEQTLSGTGYELVDVEYKKEGADWYLRVYIDHEQGIGLDDCERVSRQLEQRLDAEDPIPDSYILEVSSPGIERPLKKDKDFQRFAGRKVTAHTYGPHLGKKCFQGRLLGLKGQDIAIQDGADEVLLPRDKVSLIHLSVDI